MAQLEISVFDIRNIDDTFLIVLFKQKLDAILQLGLNPDYSKYAAEIIEFSMTIKDTGKIHYILRRITYNTCYLYTPVFFPRR